MFNKLRKSVLITAGFVLLFPCFFSGCIGDSDSDSEIDSYSWIVIINADTDNYYITSIDATLNGTETETLTEDIEYDEGVICKAEDSYTTAVFKIYDNTNSSLSTGTLSLTLGNIWIIEWKHSGITKYEDDAENYEDILTGKAVSDSTIMKRI